MPVERQLAHYAINVAKHLQNQAAIARNIAQGSMFQQIAALLTEHDWTHHFCGPSPTTPAAGVSGSKAASSQQSSPFATPPALQRIFMNNMSARSVAHPGAPAFSSKDFAPDASRSESKHCADGPCIPNEVIGEARVGNDDPCSPKRSRDERVESATIGAHAADERTALTPRRQGRRGGVGFDTVPTEQWEFAHTMC